MSQSIRYVGTTSATIAGALNPFSPIIHLRKQAATPRHLYVFVTQYMAIGQQYEWNEINTQFVIHHNATGPENLLCYN